MKCKITLCFAMLAVVSATGERSLPTRGQEPTSEKPNVVYKVSGESSGAKPKSLRPKSGVTTLDLSSDVDAYVFDTENFLCIEKEEADDYLASGGAIVVADESITSDILTDKVSVETADFDYNDAEETAFKGVYIYNDSDSNRLVNVTTGYLSGESAQVGDGESADSTGFEAIADSMVESALSKISTRNNWSQVHLEGFSGGSSIEQSDTSGEIIATGYLENFLFNESNKDELMCSYTIKTDILDVSKIRESSGRKRGMYDCRSVFTVDAEPQCSVENYSVSMESEGTVVDASYLNSNTSTTVSLGGSFGVEGSTLTGSVNCGFSYTYNADSQEIVNDLKAGSSKIWYSTVVDPIANASKKLEPAIRFVTDNDSRKSTQSSRVENFVVSKNCWLFKANYKMMDKYRTRLDLTLNGDGTFSQNIVQG